jgi:hypothetical protein
MSALGTKQTVKYVKRPSSNGAKDTRPAPIGHSGNYKQKKVQPKGR